MARKETAQEKHEREITAAMRVLQDKRNREYWARQDAIREQARLCNPSTWLHTEITGTYAELTGRKPAAD